MNWKFALRIAGFFVVILALLATPTQALDIGIVSPRAERWSIGSYVQYNQRDLQVGDRPATEATTRRRAIVETYSLTDDVVFRGNISSSQLQFSGAEVFDGDWTISGEANGAILWQWNKDWNLAFNGGYSFVRGAGWHLVESRVGRLKLPGPMGLGSGVADPAHAWW